MADDPIQAIRKASGSPMRGALHAVLPAGDRLGPWQRASSCAFYFDIDDSLYARGLGAGQVGRTARAFNTIWSDA